jgi:hypothetical protein
VKNHPLIMARTTHTKNTKNKAKHTKLLNRKKNKLRKESDLRKARLKEIMEQANQNKSENEHR